MKSLLPITAVLAVTLSCAPGQAEFDHTADVHQILPTVHPFQLAQADTGTPEKPKPGGEGEPRPGGGPAGKPKAGEATPGKMSPEKPQPGQSGEGQPVPGGKPAMPGEAPRQGESGKKGPPEKSGQPAERPKPSEGAPKPKQGGMAAPRSGKVTIRTEQRTKIVSVIRGLSIRPVTNVGVRVAVGVAIPRAVQLRPLPPEVIEVVPEYRGYLFFLAPEGIVVVDPDSLEVIDIIEI